MRPAQQYMYDNMWYRNVILKARQLGFSTFIQIFMLDMVFWTPNITAVIIAHTKEAAKDIFNTKIKYAYEHLPEELREMNPFVKNEAGELRLANNSAVKVTTSGRSGTAQLLHISELGKICVKYPAKAREILTGSLPAVHEGGFAWVESTAEGQAGEFYDMCKISEEMMFTGKALSKLDFKFHFFPWYQNPTNITDPTKVIIKKNCKKYLKEIEAKLKIKLTDEQKAWYAVIKDGAAGMGDDMWRENPSESEEAFRASTKGAYYKDWMNAAYREGRVGKFPYNPNYLVHTAWDIGHDDATAIWFWQYIDGMYRFIDYEENIQTDLPYWVDILKKKGYKYDRFVAPFDMNKTEWGSGKTARELAVDEHNIAFEVAPKLSIIDGINAVRRLLPYCQFDEENCADGLKCLTSYRAEWDDKAGMWKKDALHDWSSHGSDSFRYFAVVQPEPGHQQIERHSTKIGQCRQVRKK